MKRKTNFWRKSGVLALLFIAFSALGWVLWHFGEKIGLDSTDKKLFAGLLIVLIGTLPRFLPILITQRRHAPSLQQSGVLPPEAKRLSAASAPTLVITEVQAHLRAQYGIFWRIKTKILLVVGEPADLESVVPELCARHWLEANRTVLLWGDAPEQTDPALWQSLQKLHCLRRRPLDGMVWISNKFSTLENSAFTATARRAFQQRFQTLGWQIPLYLWEVIAMSDNHTSRTRQSVGCMTDNKTFASSLQALLPLLVRTGTQQIVAHPCHDFLLSLACRLREGGIEALNKGQEILLNDRLKIPVAGVMFSPSLLPSVLNQGNNLSDFWQDNPNWQALAVSLIRLPAVLAPRRLGFQWIKLATYGLASGLIFCAMALPVSFIANRNLIHKIAFQQTQHQPLQRSYPEKLAAQHALQLTLLNLQERNKTGVPLFYRFGLDQNDALLNALWPYYHVNNRLLLIDKFQQKIHQAFSLLINTPPRHSAFSKRSVAAYQQLKAYLMMARPERVSTAFLNTVLLENPSLPQDVDPRLWRSLGPSLIAFYVENLPTHPQWHIIPDDKLVAEVRRILIGQYQQQQTETALYQQLMQPLGKVYGDLTLAQMTGDTDASQLFFTTEVVPGIFTRKAWQEQVSAAIDNIASAWGKEFDWVLTDDQHAMVPKLSPEALKIRLTQRYLNDFAHRWLDFANSIRWKSARSLSEAADQLQLMTDKQYSPVIALLNTLAYQAQTAQSVKDYSHPLAESAKKFFNFDKLSSGIQQIEGKPETNPLNDAFAPLAALLEGNTAKTHEDAMSLSAFHTRINRLWLRLQQITAAADPQAMSHALAQAEFQGKSTHYSELRDYGGLVAASLGQQWNNFAQALFIEPVEQAWKQLLTPTAAHLNAQWKSTLVEPWNSAFIGRYPFNNVAASASLPLLSHYLRADGGRIQRFFESNLGGILRKEGHQWVPDPVFAQSLTFDPAFLETINRLSLLADEVFVNGDAGLHFELRPGTAKKVMQTDLVLDGQSLSYFNQKPTWQRFSWPKDTQAPGATLSWLSTETGTRIYADYSDAWGFIRLLEKAKLKDSVGSLTQFALTWRTPDGLLLNYTLRTEFGRGPLALLSLKGLVIPKTIFSIQNSSSSNTKGEEE